MNDKKKMTASHKAGILAQSRKRAERSMKKSKKEGFVQGLKSEMKKVTWPEKGELKVFTKVVLLSTVLFGFGIYFIDLVLRGVMNGLHAIMSLIAG